MSDLNDWYNYGPGRVETAENGIAKPISEREQKKAEKRSDRNSKTTGRTFGLKR